MGFSKQEYWSGVPLHSPNSDARLTKFTVTEFNSIKFLELTNNFWGLPSRALMVKNLPASVGDLRDMGSILVSGRSAEGGHSNPLKEGK